MNVLDYLDNLRQKPEQDRKRILMIWTVGGTIFVIILWVLNLMFILPTPDILPAQTEKAGQEEIAEPGFFDRVQNGFAIVVGKVFNFSK